MIIAALTALTAFAVILLAELPDKTMVATLVLATRFRPLPVWLGVAAAFFVQCLIAVTAGGLLTLLPRRPLLAVTAALFTLGSVLLFRHAKTARERETAAEQEYEQELATTAPQSGRRAAIISFGVLFAAEWGDLSQVFTAGLVVRTGEPVAVFAGAWVALILIAALAVTVGQTLVRKVSLAAVSWLGSVLLAVVAIVTAAEALGAQLPI